MDRVNGQAAGGLTLGPLAAAGLDSAASGVMRDRHPRRRYVVVREEADAPIERPAPALHDDRGQRAA